jgi:signal-transduction protein with cAMP-binding, CBS, and nucleotidyltransferase domain
MRTVKQLLDAKGRRIVAIAPEAPVLEAIQIMADEHIGALLVMREDAVAGICSERDYARKVILRGRSSAETEVWEIMSSPVLSVGPSDTVNGCMRLMTNHRIRHLPVIEDGVATGMLSIGDLVKAVIEDQQHEIDQLKQYVQG